jgi:hypothetical protein
VSEWAARQVREVLDGGPAEGDTFFRVKVMGRVESKWVNVTFGELHAIAAALTAPGDTPPCEHDLEEFSLVEDGYQRQWYTEIDEDEKVIHASYHGASDWSDEGDGGEYLQCGICAKTRPVPDDYEINWK